MGSWHRSALRGQPQQPVFGEATAILPVFICRIRQPSRSRRSRSRLNAREHYVGLLLSRYQGLMMAKGTTRRIRGLGDVAKLGLRFVNRERGSATRLLFDALLAREGLAPARIQDYEHEEFTHMATALPFEAGWPTSRSISKAAARAQAHLRASRHGTLLPRMPAQRARPLCSGADYRPNVEAIAAKVHGVARPVERALRTFVIGGIAVPSSRRLSHRHRFRSATSICKRMHERPPSRLQPAKQVLSIASDAMYYICRNKTAGARRASHKQATQNVSKVARLTCMPYLWRKSVDMNHRRFLRCGSWRSSLAMLGFSPQPVLAETRSFKRTTGRVTRVRTARLAAASSCIA